MNFIFYILAALALTGCASSRADRASMVPPYHPNNVYVAKGHLNFTRVALLPMLVQPGQGNSLSVQAIEEALKAELINAKRFEVVNVSADELLEWTSHREIGTLEGEWPLSLKKALETRQIDGIMVVELTHLKGYHPIALGVKMRLVETATAKTVWATDELMDMGSPTVFAAAKQYEKGMLLDTGKIRNPGSIEMSPTKLAKFAGYMIYNTLPEGR